MKMDFITRIKLLDLDIYVPQLTVFKLNSSKV